MDMLKSPGTGQNFSSPEPQPAQEQHVSSDLEDGGGWQVEWGLLLPGLFLPLFCPQHWDCCEIISLPLIVLFSHSMPYNGTLLTAFDGEVRGKDSWVWIAGGYLRVAGLHAYKPRSTWRYKVRLTGERCLDTVMWSERAEDTRKEAGRVVESCQTPLMILSGIRGSQWGQDRKWSRDLGLHLKNRQSTSLQGHFSGHARQIRQGRAPEPGTPLNVSFLFRHLNSHWLEGTVSVNTKAVCHSLTVVCKGQINAETDRQNEWIKQLWINLQFSNMFLLSSGRIR